MLRMPRGGLVPQEALAEVPWAEPPTHIRPGKGAPGQATLLGCSYKALFRGPGDGRAPARLLPKPGLLPDNTSPLEDSASSLEGVSE